MVFTFGKYAGMPLSEIPASYLGLAIETFTMPEPLLEQCRDELLSRLVQSCNGLTPVQSADYLLRVKTAYRTLALKYHPDRGGSTSAMQALNDYHKALLQWTISK